MIPPGPAAGSCLLDPGDAAALEAYLMRRGWLEPGEVIERVAPAGAGNMNLVLRVQTAQRSLIVKQGRGWVEKYPSIAAPAGRTLTEASWYRLAGRVSGLAARLPRVLGLDRASRVLVLADLGDGGDFTGMYAGQRLPAGQLDALVCWLAALHLEFAGDRRARLLRNREMRALNHEHIFALPLRPGNGLDPDAITPGLARLAAGLAADRRLATGLAGLGGRYLGPGRTLLHGDFYPGSWLAGPSGPYVIDPEFGFYGPPEFDLGVLLAHLELSGHPGGTAERVAGLYLDLAPADVTLAWGFAGAEVIRRLLGVAQLPLPAGLAAKRRLLEAAAARVRAVA